MAAGLEVPNDRLIEGGGRWLEVGGGGVIVGGGVEAGGGIYGAWVIPAVERLLQVLEQGGGGQLEAAGGCVVEAVGGPLEVTGGLV